MGKWVIIATLAILLFELAIPAITMALAGPGHVIIAKAIATNPTVKCIWPGPNCNP